jgi:hypothetical protein
MLTVEVLTDRVLNHRVYDHAVFTHWADSPPGAPATAAMFHQIQKFCASTRPGLGFSEGLARIGLDEQRRLIDEIVASESGHGPELATMAGHVVNRIGPEPVFVDVNDQAAVEGGLRASSDQLLGSLPGYDRTEGLTVQARTAIGVFERRALTDPEATYRNLGTALALEIISNQSLIPGEKRAIVDSGNYGVTLDDPELHYLAEHWGECGAEQQHEKNVIEAVAGAIDPTTAPLISAGVDDFIQSVANLWDLLDSALLQSGEVRP